jgi:hypothetical protein
MFSSNSISVKVTVLPKETIPVHKSIRLSPFSSTIASYIPAPRSNMLWAFCSWSLRHSRFTFIGGSLPSAEVMNRRLRYGVSFAMLLEV